MANITKLLVGATNYDIPDTLNSLTNVTISSPSNGQALVYDSSSQRWVNGSGSTGHTYSTSEQAVGKWIDGSDIYEITYEYAANQSLDANHVWVDSNLPSSLAANMDKLIDVKLYTADGCGFYCHFTKIENGSLMLYNHSYAGWAYKIITVQYTKATATRSLSKGTTTDLKADLSGEKQILDEISTDTETSLKKANTEDEDETTSEIDTITDEGEQTDES